MKRIIIVTILLASILLWLGYSLFSNNERVVWDYISQESKFVYSLPNNPGNSFPPDFLNMLDIMSQSFLRDTYFLIENSLFEKNKTDIKTVLENRNAKNYKSYIVGYSTGLKKTGIVYIIESDTDKAKSLSMSIYKRLKNNSQSVTKSEYNGNIISTFNINPQQERGKIGVFTHENFIFLSTYTTLLEESSRLIHQHEWFKVKSLKHITASDRKIAPLGQIFVKGNKTSYLNTIFGLQTYPINSNNIIGRNVRFDISGSPVSNMVIFDGVFENIKQDEDGVKNEIINDYLDTFKGQPSVKSTDIFSFIPSNATKAIHFNCTDIPLWSKGQIALFSSDFFRDENKAFGTLKDAILLPFLNGLKNGITLIELPAVEFTLQGKMIVSSVKNKAKTLKNIQMMQEHYKKDSLLKKEYFNENIIYQLDINNFPKRAFGPTFDGFELCYFSFYKDKIMIANDIEYLTGALNRINLNKTWANTEKFKDNFSMDAYVSYFENTEEIGNRNSETYTNNSKEMVSLPLSTAKNIKNIMAYYRISNENLHIQFFYALKDIKKSSTNDSIQSFEKNRSYWLDNDITTSSNTILDKNSNVFSCFQDSDNTILLAKNFYVSFEKTLYAKISSNISLTMSKENELKQIMFATPDSLFVLDENGNNIGDYPVTYSDGNIFSLQHFDNDKQNIMLVDRQGNIFVFDHTGKTDENWSPYKMESQLSFKPQTININEKTYYLFQHKNGNIDIKDTMGESIIGFPNNINDKLLSPTHIRVGVDFQDTLITVIGENGSITRLNMLGKVLLKKQMLKKNLNTKFYLILEASKKGFVIAEETEGDIKFYNQLEQYLFSAPLSLQNKYKIQYYNFGAKYKYYIVNDNEQSISYIYNSKYALIGNEPISAIVDVNLFLDKKKKLLQIFSTYESQYYESIIKQN